MHEARTVLLFQPFMHDTGHKLPLLILEPWLWKLSPLSPISRHIIVSPSKDKLVSQPFPFMACLSFVIFEDKYCIFVSELTPG